MSCLNTLSPVALRQGLSLNWKLAGLARPAGGTCLSASAHAGVTGMTAVWLFTGLREIQTQVLVLAVQA